ncbi:MAG: pyruvate ferredoxin oxidoreductase [Rhodospirillaceae bacterium]|jgi:2-oxoglutarate ferredoxin oxidoreductase subunit gamma|nr:pyruvate ferredoxin oxidoreductase [Rhodospirillaceae bacterium]MBT5242739.1 pyruvate ferredoxin oxidoreductase [Rhodospirillaceae bacterium]MBT5561552.1 pyruvate ferredoxin oxidoreductase [Rhodospirillaceae bacterium]MBT6241850.1 pyruvate ferredoxin oxidoreductase [Rhodospirillaceae bacterium]MBT7138651.1 pyruvate ferredoxin oxidoreductase [Rhodospirillaceae bacterium]
MQDYEIRFSGSGGQGLQLSAKILAYALNLADKRIAQSQSYEPTSRGGLSRSDLVVSEGVAVYPLVTSLDYLIVLDQDALDISLPLLKEQSIVIADTRHVPEPPSGAYSVYHLPLSETALKLGNERVANIISLGALISLGDICSYAFLEEAVRAMVPSKFLTLNLEALAEGYGMAEGKDVPESAVAS